MEVLGLMSGTSLDGLDLVLVSFSERSTGWHYAIKQATTVPYTIKGRNRLSNAIDLSGLDLRRLHKSYGAWVARIIQKTTPQWDCQTPDLIGFSGHTVFHYPSEQWTFQVGDPQIVATKTTVPVVGDFRQKDMILGGQGAPLVPIGDALLFGQYDVCLNIGGVSNLSYDNGDKRVAYDIGLANLMMNYLARKVGLDIDIDGKIAKKGQMLPTLLEQLNTLSFFTMSGSKSTGVEMLNDSVIPLLNASKGAHADLMATVTHHAAYQIATSLNTIKKDHFLTKEMTVFGTGGGMFNPILLDALKKRLAKGITLIKPSDLEINYKEAIIFAFLAYLRVHDNINCLSSVTGADTDCCSGTLYTV